MKSGKHLANPSSQSGVRAMVVASVLAIAVWLSAASPVQAATIPVSASCTITQAINAANMDSVVGGCNAGSGADTVVLTPTVYALSVADNSFGSQGGNGLPAITSTVTIRGNGATIARNLAYSCPGGSDPDFRLLYVDAIGDLTLEDVTLRNGCADNSYGGALYNFNGNVKVQGSVFDTNSADYGGALYNADGNMNVQGSVARANSAYSGGAFFNIGTSAYLTITMQSGVYSNTVTIGGGGLYNQQGSVKVLDSAFRANTSNSYGGGFYISSGTASIEGTDVYSNSSGGSAGGGGLFNQGANVAISHSMFYSNTSEGFGGGIYTQVSSVMTITGASEIYANSAVNGGGGVYNRQSTLTVTESSVYSNTAQTGGGLFNSTGDLTLLNSAVYSNSAASGGGLANLFANTVMTITDQSRIYANTATNGGGGIYNYSDAIMTVQDSEVYSNSAASGGGISNVDTDITVHDSMIYSNTATTYGGGLYIGSGTLNMQSSRVIFNRAGFDAGAILQYDGSTAITESCIVGNSHTAVVYNDGTTPVTATQNWWGMADGPSGAGPGNGDSVTSDVDFSSFATSPILDCPTLPLLQIYFPMITTQE